MKPHVCLLILGLSFSYPIQSSCSTTEQDPTQNVFTYLNLCPPGSMVFENGIGVAFKCCFNVTAQKLRAALKQHKNIDTENFKTMIGSTEWKDDETLGKHKDPFEKSGFRVHYIPAHVSTP